MGVFKLGNLGNLVLNALSEWYCVEALEGAKKKEEDQEVQAQQNTPYLSGISIIGSEERLRISSIILCL